MLSTACEGYVVQYNPDGYKNPDDDPGTEEPVTPDENPVTFEATATEKWMDTDMIAMYAFDDGMQNYYCEAIGISSGIGEETASFASVRDAETWKGETANTVTFAGYYPATTVPATVSGSKIETEIPSVQSGDSHAFGLNFGKQEVSVTTLDSDNKVFVDFHPLSSSITLSPVLAAGMSGTQLSISELTVTIPESDIAGKVQLDVQSGEISTASGASSSVTAVLGQPVNVTASTGDGNVSIAIIPVSASCSVNISGKTSDGETVIFKSVDVPENSLSAGAAFNVTAEITDMIQCANSYMIDADKMPEDFKLGLQQAVDGSQAIADLEGTGTGVEKIIASGDWEIVTLWKTWPGTENITEKSGSRSNAVAVLEFPDISNGNNALIGLKGRTDGKIYWSWHFWFTDYNPDAASEAEMNGQVHTYFGDAFASLGKHHGKVMMDRNLGATITGVQGAISQPATNAEAAKYYGLHYQFGRKDPFPGSADGTAGNRVTLYDASGNPIIPASEGSASTTLLMSVNNPSKFYFNAGKNWLGNESLQDLWDSSGDSKSVFDPCPAGWRMPLGAGDGDGDSPGYRNIWAGWGKNSPSSIGSGTTPEYAIWKSAVGSEKGTAGILYYYPDDNTQAWYPAPGIIEQADGTFKNVGGATVVWSATNRLSNTTDARRLNANGSKVEPSSSSKRGGGFNVRCIKL